MPQTIVPFIAYEDAAAAIDWLTRAFGFRENEAARHMDVSEDFVFAQGKYGASR